MSTPAEIQAPEHTLHLTLACVWQMHIKMQLGKLALRLPLAEVLREQQRGNGLLMERVTLEDILALDTLPPLHRDRFDRRLVPQAARGGFHLVGHEPENSRHPVRVFLQ